MRDRVLLRYLLAREQLTPALDHIEKLALSEKWGEADHAMNALKNKLGFFIRGDTFRIHSEWIHNLSKPDQDRVLDFAHTLANIDQEIQAGLNPGLPRREVMWLEAQFRNAREDMRWLNEVMRDESDAIKVESFTVYLMGSLAQAEGAIDTLKKASDLIRPKFPKVLYGKVYVREGLNGNKAGSYVTATDTINLSMYARPDRNSVDTLIHEFGHRFEERFLGHERRKEFIQLYEVGDLKPVAFTHEQRLKAAEAMLSRWRKQRDDPNYDWETIDEADREWLDVYPRERYKHYVIPLKKEFDAGEPVDKELLKALGRLGESGDVVVPTETNPTPLYASDYGSTSWKENFAESFLHFITHRALPEGLQRFMSSL
jgi:hypothetical protein